MKKWMWFPIVISPLIVALSMAYYYIYYLPNQNNKIHLPDIKGASNILSPTLEPSLQTTITPPPTTQTPVRIRSIPTSSPIPTPTNVPDYTNICSAKKEVWIGEQKSYWNEVSLGLYDRLKDCPRTDPKCSYLQSIVVEKMERIRAQVETCILYCAPKMHIHCLEHDGKIDSFNVKAECPSCDISSLIN